MNGFCSFVLRVGPVSQVVEYKNAGDRDKHTKQSENSSFPRKLSHYAWFIVVVHLSCLGHCYNL
jgi:hypothetical protein